MEELKEEKVISGKPLTWGRVLKMVIFAALFIGIAWIVSYMLTPKNSRPDGGLSNPNARGFYGEPENTIDMVVIGNSGAYSGFSAMELWNKYGYTSYICAEGSQNLGESICIFEELLEKQSPKLVIIDADCFWAGGNEIGRMEYNAKSVIYKYLPIFKYHDRWKTVEAKDFFAKKDYNNFVPFKGQFVARKIQAPKKEFVFEKTDVVEEIPFTSKRYLEKLIDICDENGIQVMFIDIPATHSWNYAKHNGVQEYADEKNIPFVDCSLMKGKNKIDWSKDTRDGGHHMNYRGAKKCTKYIGKYISDNYEISDKRDLKEYEIWNDCYKEYKRVIKGK